MKIFKEWLAEKGENLEGMEAEKQGALMSEYIAEIAKTLAESVDNGATKEELEAMRKEIVKVQGENQEVTQRILKDQGKAIKEALNKLNGKEVVTEKSIKEQLIENKAEIEKWKNGENVRITLKAVGDMSIAGNVTGAVPQAERIPGMNAVASREVKFLDVLQKGSISSNLIEWVYQTGKEGTAGQTAEAAAKNQIDFDLVVASQKVEKTTAYIRVTDEMLEDVDFMASEINMELGRELEKAVESGAYGGNGTTPNLNGVNTVATAWAAGTHALAVDNANLVDVLRVGIDQIAIAEQSAPTAIWMHPSDVTTLQLTKSNATQNLYATELAIIAGQLMLDGIPIHKSTLVTQDNFLIGDFTKAHMRTKKGVTVEIGLDSDDFTKNFKTIRAEWRGVVYVKNNDRTAFVKGVFSTSITALETT